jgi:hypothetical protein
MKDGSISNLRTWKKQDIIDEYAASTELQPPEKAILDTLRDQLRQMKMLDIGVGAGAQRCTSPKQQKNNGRSITPRRYRRVQGKVSRCF